MTATALPVVEQAARDILDTGYAVVKLSELDAGNLHDAIVTAIQFFQRPDAEKRVHGSADHNYGYRPFGIEYSNGLPAYETVVKSPDGASVASVWS